ncbi:MAG: carbohydrate ABC transporter permease [Firmicutes bacterium]|nr:carbohydrate ABC transporter permease [Bacillota bacterium]
MKMDRVKRTISVVILSFGALCILFPIAWMISTALKPLSDAFDGQLIPSHPTLSNFTALFAPGAAGSVARWLGNSLFVSITVSVLVMIIDSMAAFALARLQFFGRTALFYVVVISLVVPFIALLIPLYLEFANANLLDTYWVLILPYTSNAFGVFLLYQFFLGIPKELEEAAMMDGVNKFQLWRRIMVPLSVPATATLGLLTFMNVYNDFFWPLVATTSQDMRTMTVGVQLMAVGQYNTNDSLLMALTLCSVIPMVLAFLFAQKQLTQGIATTGTNL